MELVSQIIIIIIVIIIIIIIIIILQIEEHEKALDILVHKLKDFKGAEQYCRNNTKNRELKYKHNLFHTLLGVYLDPKLG